MAFTRLGIIGGTGVQERLLGGLETARAEQVSPETPFGSPSAPVLLGEVRGTPVAILSRHGAGHLRNPAAVPYRANVFALKAAGCTHVLAFGATGSLREDIAPGELVVCDQLIDRTEGRPRTFYDRAAVHVEFAEPFCPVMRRWLLAAARRPDGAKVHDGGCYVCMQGPSFSTRAESHLYRQWGADVVGMTALPEARLAREAEMAYALVALPTDYDCWRPRAGGDADSLLGEIVANLARATEASLRLVETAVADVGPLRAEPSPAHDALARAIWTDRAAVERAEIDRLRPLWDRHW